ncbi:hypothetical protein GCM10007973_28780 [Polymorphobacter multimanifer]|uniref:Molecular chaperone DnaJ n=1 Tax=Polymorphobacter multimanifer TaxID=1070431 RepID=A0A841L280_9SPHN|nr:J domain-containing protein [Polymorphobacter multimanifer]MBB6226540.1 hypothetical protein [Polymorphobacter multimanifer]GGI90695.1 hypothetical protein GCM10007973_28780 [Polymorphobacter multimanifer]
MALLSLLGAFALWWLWPRKAKRGTGARAEARRLLGVSENADRAAIETAFRMQLQAAHPDHGGTSLETRRLTAARDLLLASKPQAGQ